MTLPQKIVLLTLSLALTHEAYATPPYITDDATPEAYKHTEIYAFGIYNRGNPGTTVALPGIEIDYGLIPDLEINATAFYVTNYPKYSNQPNVSGMGDSNLALKYLVFHGSDCLPEIAFEPVFYVPTGDENKGLGNGRSWEQYPIWMQKSWGAWTLSGGGGYATNSAPSARNFFFGGFILQKNMTDKLNLGAEFYMQGASATTLSAFKLLNFGAEYHVNNTLGAVLGLAHTIAGDEFTHIYLALHLSFV